MPAEAPRAPLSVYMLADHLDAALAAGEDLIARGQDLRQLMEAPGNVQTFLQRQRETVDDIRALELISIARILKARDHAAALATMDQRFAAVANLFVSGTAILLDSVEECGDATADDFETGDAIIAYVRSRGLIAADAAAVSKPAQISIDETFLVAKRLPLGALMDLAATFLDALELRYELFASDDEAVEDAMEGAVQGLLDRGRSEPASALAEETGLQGEAETEAEPQPLAEVATPAAPEPSSSPLSRLSSSLTPRREFGQRHRSPLN